MKTTTIAWTEATWNPVTGCTKIPGPHGSPSGCDNCYAFTLAERFRGTPGHYYEHGFDVTLRPQRIDDPLTWTKPRRIFVNSMSDLFHDAIPDRFVIEACETMFFADWHVFQVLTKRPERMRRAFRWLYDPRGPWSHLNAERFPMPNVWLGVSVCSMADAWRVQMLRETPAAIRFLSLEPLLGRIDAAVLDGMDWIIIGGESGRGARALDEEWTRSIIAACRAKRIPVFNKQMGSVWAKQHGLTGKAETPAEWPEDLRVREYPTHG